MDLSIALIGISLLIALIIIGMPIAFALFISGVVGMGFLVGFEKTFSLYGSMPFESINVYSLSAIPAFIAMGNLGKLSGITENFFDVATKWFSKIKGGLAIASVFAAGGFAAVTGSSIASASAMAPICIPAMLKKGYSKKLAAGSVAGGNMLGIMIPPSITMVIYGEITGASVGKCLMSGVLPGILSVIAFALLVYLWVIIKPASAPPTGERFSYFEKIKAIFSTWRLWVIVLIVFGGIYSGFATPTETGGYAAIICLIFCLITPNKKITVILKEIASAFIASAITSTMIFAIMIGSSFFNQFLVISGLPGFVADWISKSGLSPYVILWLILLIYVPLGMFLDGASMMLITIPIYLPLFKVLGFDLVHMAVLITGMVELGLITPPMGLNAYVVKGVMPELSLVNDVFAGCVPFMFCQMIIIAILVYFPIISLFLPNLM